MLAGCGRSRAVGSDCCRIAVSLAEACRMGPGSCCLTVLGHAFQIASLELCVRNWGAGKIEYFKLPKRGYSKKILIHTFGNGSYFHPLYLIDSIAGRGHLRSFTAGSYQFKMIESQSHLWHFFWAKINFSVVSSVAYSAVIIQSLFHNTASGCYTWLWSFLH